MKTKIICILDKSGSMSSIIDDAIGGFNHFLNEQKKLEDCAYMDIILFNNKYDKVVNNTDVRKVLEMTTDKYSPSSTTALYDAIGTAIDEEVDFIAESADKPDKTICVILTDGQENASQKYNQDRIKLMIDEMQSEFNWTFIFLAANQDSFTSASKIGISKGNSMDFTGDSKGIKMAYSTISNSVSYYRSTNKDEYSDILKK